ncbi:MAG TPA: dihydroorotate dehydrogenase-like protein [Candidatus Sulfotelmatobacter sp.]|nr:dihydroorotate dehydrogenase-like protein [Candidatus Sulfotelmatobacter sp.]
MSDLTTKYLGLALKNPLVISASPLCEELDNLRRMEDAGAAAIVLHSLFEEQLRQESEALDRFLVQGTESFAESLSYFPDMQAYNLGPEGYLEHIRKAKAAVGIPVIASLNGISTGGWIGYAKKMEQAGADALELNVYYIPTDPAMTAAQVDQMYLDLVRDVRASVKIPVAVKLGPYFSAFANTAKRLSEAGANGLVLFNRFYQPDFDLEALEVTPNLALSRSEELRLRLCWVAILADRISADLAVTGGVHTAEDVVKCMMAGAKIAMMTSALLQHGIGHVAAVRANLIEWLEKHEYSSIRQMQGSMSQRKVAQPAAFVRANYMKVLRSYNSSAR